MGKRVAVIAPMGMDPEIDILRQIIEGVFIRNAEKVKEGDTEVVFHLLNSGFTDIDFFGYLCFNVRNDYEFFEAALKVGEEGYDALVIHCAFDSMLDPLRQALDIPVVGVLQSGMLLATMMGHRFGVVTFSKTVVPYIEDIIARYGLRDRAVPVRSSESAGEEMLMSLADAHELIETFSDAARKCIADGAEVLVPG
ncbi:MAG: aspartate/glutamate racemase family protein [Actinomycetota bacterium]|nr:aspartate/glutamate racemase family protein [Actinomycetota bacterium]